MSKAVVWAHNSHLGDARATQRQDRQEWNVGQLVRERLGMKESFNCTVAKIAAEPTAELRIGQCALTAIDSLCLCYFPVYLPSLLFVSGLHDLHWHGVCGESLGRFARDDEY